MTMKLYPRVLSASCLLMALAGTVQAAPQTGPAEAEAVYGGMLNQCRTELTLLKSLDMTLFQREEQALNEDLASASQYLLMRNRLNTAMQETLDRLHQANLTRTCQQIHNVLFNQLLSKSTVAVSPGGKQ
ncbi:hypothetical protein DI333_06215 [Salmonella enterica subsp. enterica serovar Oranienburg]|uniref:Periplasmic protein n=1 Tax=Salmonella enterica subsp. enterica serovar Macclesfield str. S-1643 TaxID=1242107 RepID=A0A241PX96_SALET|nr:hypothetical protein [Salmonella enterica]EAA5488530.1 hypothetical protein [Salmonella enterica subsp. enterica serovar Kouka]EDV1506049.1 hypothetical protein [Salmonella enterica subsp. salamae]EEA5813296.1 hypothetical protein [Salmonella enterica subsp. enterica serovar Oranienburg]ASG19095.1 hypothetical protein LFZ25_24890 [Salmonella enterica subsp. enterica serovar Macclesfield str. S-1643]EED7441390.1 hypothetical protein [Salmonella enterica subsp. salamae]